MKTHLLVILFALGLTAAASAQPMNYQGRLTDNTGAPRPGPQATLTFSMWTLPTEGEKVWGDFAIDADLIDGRFSVKLGDAAGNDGTADGGRLLSDAFATDPGPRYLQIQVGDDAPLPRQEVLPAPTALHAVIADTVTDGAIGTPQLADLAVTGDKIADNTIPVAKLTGAGANFWDGNGTSVWRSSGNVGIGTTNPLQKLHVSGGYADLNGLRIGGQDSANTIWHPTNSIGITTQSENQSVKIGSNISGTVMTVVGGHVGIGTSFPGDKLSVVGNVSATGTINGQSKPYTVIITPNIGNQVDGRTIPDSVVREYLADEDGGRIRLIITRSSDGYVWVIDEVIFINPVNGKGFCTQMGGSVEDFTLMDATIENIIPAPYGVTIQDQNGYAFGGVGGTVFTDLSLRVLTGINVGLKLVIFDN